MLRNLAILAAATMCLAACQNAAQTEANTRAAVDATACLLTVVPPVVATASAPGAPDTTKAIQSATVAYMAGSQSANCRAVASDVSAAIAAGKVTAPAATTTPATPAVVAPASPPP